MFGQHRKRRKERNRAQAQLAFEQNVPVEEIKKQRKEQGLSRADFLREPLKEGKGRKGFEHLRKGTQQFQNEKNLFEADKPLREEASEQFRKEEATKNAAESKSLRQQGREEGRESAEKFFAKETQGLDPELRKVLQYEANKGIQRNMQGAQRKLLGEQSQRGILGKGGVGYAQQRDLYKMANEAQGQSHRDLTKLDRDLAMKKQAAIFAGGEGEAAQSLLDKQIALDDINLRADKKRQREFEGQVYRQLFNRA